MTGSARAGAGSAIAAVACLALLGCAGAPPSPANRTIEDPENGYALTVPERWTSFGDEIRSMGGSVFTIEILSLEDGDPEFLARLPESIVPQLQARTRYFFSVVDPETRRQTAVGGLSALEVTFPVRIRASDPPSEVVYWIVRKDERLFILRATYPASQQQEDRPAVGELLASWRFLDRPAT